MLKPTHTHAHTHSHTHIHTHTHTHTHTHAHTHTGVLEWGMVLGFGRPVLSETNTPIHTPIQSRYSSAHNLCLDSRSNGANSDATTARRSEEGRGGLDSSRYSQQSGGGGLDSKCTSLVHPSSCDGSQTGHTQFLSAEQRGFQEEEAQGKSCCCVVS